jgi:hypothetical protein
MILLTVHLLFSSSSVEVLIRFSALILSLRYHLSSNRIVIDSVVAAVTTANIETANVVIVVAN